MARRDGRTSFPLLLVVACCLPCVQPWPAAPISLLFPEPCPKTGSESTAKDGYFQSGCTVRLRCQYSASECGNRTQASLLIFAQNPDRNRTTREVQRGACWAEVEIRNITWMGNREFFVCSDTADPRNISVKRSIRVGDPPVKPRNLTVEYFPLDSVRLWVNPVKTGRDLNDNTTTWTVQYTWRDGPHLCGRTNTNSLASASDSFVACTLNLTGLYAGHGTYSKMGSVYFPISFNVTVSNLFGHSEPAVESFDLPFNVRPGEVRNPRVDMKGETWLMLSVGLPLGVDQSMLQIMSASDDSQLRLQYAVHTVSEVEENRLRPERLAFYQKFGFYRNLQEDEKATARLNLTARFPLTQEVPWQYSINQTALYVNISGLSPNTHYNVALCPVARYLGALFKMSVKEMLTSESVPVQAPSLSFSPSHCFAEQDCVSCVIYFQEIPRPLRLSEVTKYILTASLLRTGGLPGGATCDSRRNITLAADGQQNAILVPGLVAGAVYKISLVADTAKGRSPTSTCTLNARPSGVSTEVILEVRTSRDLGRPTEYRLSWYEEQLAPAAGNDMYYTHFCYADTRISDILCNTSLVTRAASTNTSSGTLHVPYHHGNVTDLHPIFFVSAIRSGVSSGLIKPKWMYSMDKAPGKVQWVKVQASADDAHSLDVYFGQGQESTVGSPPVYGRPDAYVITWGESTKDKCGSGCEALSGASIQATKLTPYVKLPLTLHGLSPRTYYCVGVKSVKGENGSDWTCSAGATGGLLDDSPSPVPIGTSVACVVAFLLFCGCFCFMRHCKHQIQTKRDKLKFSATYLPRPKISSSQLREVSEVSLSLATVQTTQRSGHMSVRASSPASSLQKTFPSHFSQHEFQKYDSAENKKEAVEEETFYSKIHRQASEFCQEFGARDGARGSETEAVCEEDGSSAKKESDFQNKDDIEYDVCKICISAERHLRESVSQRESGVDEASNDGWDSVQGQRNDDASGVRGENCFAAGRGRYVTFDPGSEDRSEFSYESEEQESCARDEDDDEDDEASDVTREGDGESEPDEDEMAEERRTGDTSFPFLPSFVVVPESSALQSPALHSRVGKVQIPAALAPSYMSTGADHSRNSDLPKDTSRTGEGIQVGISHGTVPTDQTSCVTGCPGDQIQLISAGGDTCQEPEVTPERAWPSTAKHIVVPRHILCLLEPSSSSAEPYFHF